jgi:putative addiction module CopG family antidote
MDIHLNDTLAKLVQEKIASGAFTTPVEVVEAALTFMDKRDRRLAWLRAEIDKGIKSYEENGGIAWTPELRDQLIQGAIEKAEQGKPINDALKIE